MSRVWGREETTGWPTRQPAFTITAFLVAAVSVVAVWCYRYEFVWTPLERYWYPAYANMHLMHGIGAKTGTYQLLEVENARGQHRLAVEGDVVPLDKPPLGSRVPLALSEETYRKGFRLVLQPRTSYDNEKLKAYIGHWIYQDQTLGGLSLVAWQTGAGVLLLGLVLAIPKDARRMRELRYGRRLKGPELVTLSAFNKRNRSDGIGFLQRQNRLQWVLRRRPWLQIPRVLESSHIEILGDSGTGKSALIRQALMQIAQRNETAIVYDPALEYTPQFYWPERGDLILNPLDARCPFWSPGDEIEHKSEALTLAASLFPDRHGENSFFVEGPRKIFAHLLSLKPTPEELTRWMRNPAEIDRRVAGTELAAIIDTAAPAQRSGVLGSLNLIADTFNQLPSEKQTKQRWSAAAWSRSDQRGWLFLTSTPQSRKQLLPLISLWLDTLVLRLMNQGEVSVRRVWFVLDEVATLQKLPQLHTAITENRKSNNPVILGFQGRSQLETRYGHEAESMLSQPATKIFLRTSEPRAAQWISDTIGEVEIEQLRESHTSGHFPHHRKSKSYQLERRVEPLVMASEIGGLPSLYGYLKLGNLVARMCFPYIELPNVQPKFIARGMDVGEAQTPVLAMPPSDGPTSGQRIEPQQEKSQQQQQVRKRAAGGGHFFE
jgi:Type IV secretion-system coupling protein DNA-binding domain